MDDLVSIIMPIFNSARYIRSAINSIQAQTYKNWELLLIDDSSQDDSLIIVESIIKNDSRMKLKKLQSNYGSAYARNKGIDLSQGRFLAFLDSDDIWHPEKLDKQISFMKENMYSFTFTSYNKIDDQGSKIGSVIINKNELVYADLLYTNSIGCLTVVLDIKALGGKPYMPLIKKRNDYALWLSILKKGFKAYGLTEILAEYRYRTSSLSSNKLQVLRYQWEIYRLYQEFGVIKSFYYMVFYAFNGFKKNNY
jgi:glycosyltransferase involved in cell wall biosynthesis